MKKKKMYMYKKEKIFPKANTRVIKTKKSSWISDCAEPKMRTKWELSLEKEVKEAHLGEE